MQETETASSSPSYHVFFLLPLEGNILICEYIRFQKLDSVK
jgi:hypothetical protein